MDMTSPDLDTDGQPPPRFNQHLRTRRTLDELLGICRGTILDGLALEKGSGRGPRFELTGDVEVAATILSTLLAQPAR